jgi:AcrR family transcriptional regulator
MHSTRKKTEVRRQEIIWTARKLISAKGMESLTMQAIAAEVGLTEGAIYRHFASKQEILLLLVEEIEETLLETLRKVQAEEGAPLERLERILKAHFSLVERRGGISFIVIAEILRSQDKKLRRRVSAFLDAYLHVIKDVLQQGVESGEVRKDVDLDAAATIFLGLIQSSVTLWHLGYHAFPSLERRTLLWSLYSEGIVARADHETAAP